MKAVRAFFRLAAFCLAGFATAGHAGETGAVDLQLVLAADVSSSMSVSELRLQRASYVAAFRSADVATAILSGPLGRIAVTYVEWSGPADQTVVVPWTVLADAEGIADFARRLATGAMGRHGGHTALSSALLSCAEQFRSSGLRSNGRTIDISGDGVGDVGPPLARARDLVVSQGITVNGLAVTLPATERYGPFAYLYGSNDADVYAYYRDEVIGGLGAFVLPVDDLAGFSAAIERKLVLEIAAR